VYKKKSRDYPAFFFCLGLLDFGGGAARGCGGVFSIRLSTSSSFSVALPELALLRVISYVWPNVG
jgi:hypothetical protein